MALINLDAIGEINETHDVRMNGNIYKVKVFTTEEVLSYDGNAQKLNTDERMELIFSTVAQKFNNPEITGKFLKENIGSDPYMKVISLFRILNGDGFNKEDYEIRIKNAMKIALNTKA